MTATIVTASVVPHAKRDVATAGSSPADAYSLKNGGKTATMTVHQNAELAQSYMAQARSSGRPSPIRARTWLMLEGLPRDPLAQQGVHDDVSGSFAQEQVLLDERGQRRLHARWSAQSMSRPRVGREQLASILQHDRAQDAALGQR